MNTEEEAFDEFLLELTEMKKIGMRVPKKAYTIFSPKEVLEYRKNSMKLSQIADLAISMCY